MELTRQKKEIVYRSAEGFDGKIEHTYKLKRYAGSEWTTSKSNVNVLSQIFNKNI